MTNQKKLDNLISSLEKKIDQLNKEKSKQEAPATIEVICSQDDIERRVKK